MKVKEAWEDLNLKWVCLLVDTKWGVKPRDQELRAAALMNPRLGFII
ncbi:BnaCnng64300D [Brassica napus]|uniref:(rape) hypothetical protein n=1 Tax=Brassica napus TaxID=3708 RepID=A0A078JRX0_BRANA|nr:unnamed protein product [Brassica napus]CDY69579.1 BnaCnng64300D [Brassica napus]